MKKLSDNTNYYLLTVIIIIAAILRFHNITQPFIDAFSWRQSSTAMMADNFYHKNWNIFYPEVNWTGNQPSYQGREFQTVSYITALLYVLVGQHDWVGRSVAVLFGLWGIFALYQLVRRVWDEEHALLSAAAIAILPGSIFIDRSFLPDPAMVSLVTTSLWLLVVYLQTQRQRYLLLASIIATWGFLTKIPGLIVTIPMLYAVFAYRDRLSKSKQRVIAIASVCTLIPVLAYYLWVRHLALTYPPHHFAGEGNWLWDNGILQWWQEKYFLPQLIGHFQGWMWTTPIIILVGFGLLLPPRQPQPKLAWLFHWWIAAGVMYYLIGAQQLVTNSWNFHIINPAAAPLAAHGLLALVSSLISLLQPRISLLRWVRLPLISTLVIVLMLGGFTRTSLINMYYPAPPWYAYQGYKLGLTLRQITQPGELVVTISNAIGDPVAIYYSQRRGWVFPPNYPGEWLSQIPEDQESIRALEELRANGADFLGIVNQQKEEIWRHRPQFVQHLQRSCELVSETTEAVIYRCQR